MEDHLTDDQTDETSNARATSEPDEPEPDDELWDSGEDCAYFGGGGSKPISLATLYRNLGKVYPRPINVSLNVVRWLPHECREARKRMIAERAQPKPKPAKPRGRKRGASTTKAKTTPATEDA